MSSNLPLVSILVITYNQEKFLEKTMDTIFENGYPNIQIVLSDDGSTDGTQKLIKDYAQKYPQQVTPVLVEKNTGITANCIRAMDACKGKYVALFSGDDLFVKGKLEKQVAIMEADEDVTICFHDMYLFSSEEEGPTDLYSTHLSSPIGKNYNDLIKNNFMGAASVMLRRSALPEGGYNTRLPIAADWLLNIEIAAKGKIVYLDEALVGYRRSPSSATIGLRKHVWEDAVRTIDILEEKGIGSEFARKSSRARLAIALFKDTQQKENLFAALTQVNQLFVEKGGWLSTPVYWAHIGLIIFNKLAFKLAQKLKGKKNA